MADVKQSWRTLIFILFSLIVSGCRAQQDEGTPTPFGTWVPVGDNRPVIVELAEIIDSPDSYEGAYIQLSGEYKRLPLLVCSSDAHPSPATWQLSSPEGIIVASGRESDLRRLVPDGLLMTVTGRMTYFEGAVGCAKRARTEQIWYLDVDQVISPNPIARVTLTPDGAPISDANTPDGNGAVAFATATAVPQLAFPTATILPTATPIVAATPIPLPLTPAITATELQPTATPTRIGSDGGTATATTTVGATSTSGGTATATTATSPAATTTPNSNNTATPTPTFGNTTTNKGALTPEEILNDELRIGEQHKWVLDTDVFDTITAYAVGDSRTDMVITILDSLTGDIIAEKDDNGAGEAESLIIDVASGEYDVILSAVGGNNGRYAALYTLDDPDIAMTMLGLISYGSAKESILAIDNDHYWVFEGEAGGEININVIPTGSTDLFIELLDYEDADDNGLGGAEDIDYTLPSDGLYIVLVGEVDYETAVYTITITKTN